MSIKLVEGGGALDSIGRNLLRAGAIALLLGMPLASCQNDAGEGPAEQAGKAIDNAAEKTGDALKEGVQDVKENAGEAAEEIKEGVQNAAEKVEDATDGATEDTSKP